jgi:hypothetical protein
MTAPIGRWSNTRERVREFHKVTVADGGFTWIPGKTGMSALSHKQTIHLGPKSAVVRCSPIVDIRVTDCSNN